MRASWSCAIAIATVAFAAEAHAETRPETRPEMRSWLLDATIGSRNGTGVTGSNLRASAAWIVRRNLAPGRTDRWWYLSVGGTATWGELRRRIEDPSVPGTTWGVAPELRTGVAFGDRGRLEVYTYLSASVGWMQWQRGSETVDDPHALRLAAGLSVPSFWRAKWHVIGEPKSALDRQPASDDSMAAAGFGAMLGSLALLAIVPLIPDTLEVSYERVLGHELVGIAVGYSL
jgi:hypothetical protein